MQPDLFLTPEVPHSGPATSRAAAVAALLKREGQLYLVYQALRRVGPEGATREELASWTGLPTNTINPRVNHLVRAGIAVEDGRTRALRSGRSGKVVTLNQEGK